MQDPNQFGPNFTEEQFAAFQRAEHHKPVNFKRPCADIVPKSQEDAELITEAVCRSMAPDSMLRNVIRATLMINWLRSLTGEPPLSVKDVEPVPKRVDG